MLDGKIIILSLFAERLNAHTRLLFNRRLPFQGDRQELFKVFLKEPRDSSGRSHFPSNTQKTHGEAKMHCSYIIVITRLFVASSFSMVFDWNIRYKRRQIAVICAT